MQLHLPVGVAVEAQLPKHTSYRNVMNLELPSWSRPKRPAAGEAGEAGEASNKSARAGARDAIKGKG